MHYDFSKLKILADLNPGFSYPIKEMAEEILCLKSFSDEIQDEQAKAIYRIGFVMSLLLFNIQYHAEEGNLDKLRDSLTDIEKHTSDAVAELKDIGLTLDR